LYISHSHAYVTQANDESRHGAASDDSSHRGENGDKSSRTGAGLLNKLRAIELEIEAVSSAIKDDASTSEEETEDGETENNLQKALATDRLKNLERAKAQIERELSESGVGPFQREDALLQKLVEERPKKRKGILKNEGESSGSKRRFKTVSYDDDADFDAVLDAASTGFMETVRFILPLSFFMKLIFCKSLGRHVSFLLFAVSCGERYTWYTMNSEKKKYWIAQKT
jgi:DNA excision repair protein ERCC-6